MRNEVNIDVAHENGSHSSYSNLPIQLVGDRILIEPSAPSEYLDEEEKIKKPVDFKEDYRRGVVVSVGGGEYGTSIPMKMVPGVAVCYWHQHAINYNVGKNTYHLVRASDVWAYV